MNKHPSQSQAVLSCLDKHAQQWVPMPELAHVSGAYAVHSRVAELRQLGYDIECRIDHDGQTKHSFYRLNKTND